MVILHAASLARPLVALQRIFEEENPGIRVVREASGSHVAARKISELGRRADIIAVADETILEELLHPQYVDWGVRFATDRIVIAYNDQSRYRHEINSDNWYEILLRDDVNFGYSDPALAPAGFYTLLSWELADRYYAGRLEGQSIAERLFDKCPARFIRPHCTELLPMLQSKNVDYIFEFQGVSKQHNLQWLKLPDEIDMGKSALGEHYRSVSVTLRDRRTGQEQGRVQGRGIFYGASIPNNAPNPEAATLFLELMLNNRGREVMAANHLPPIRPVYARGLDGTDLPERIEILLEEEPQ